METSPYPQLEAFGIKDYLNELTKKRKKREQEDKKRFPLKNVHGLNAFSGMPVDPNVASGAGIGGNSNLHTANAVTINGRNIYESIHRSQKQQLKDIYALTPTKFNAGTLKFSQGSRRLPKKGGGKRRGGKRRNYGAGPRGAVRGVASQYGWDKGREWNALVQLVQKESSWRPGAANPTSSARGLFQKMTSIHGPVERNAKGQAKWGLKYIKGRYGSPSKALAFHLRNNYY